MWLKCKWYFFKENEKVFTHADNSGHKQENQSSDVQKDDSN